MRGRLWAFVRIVAVIALVVWIPRAGRAETPIPPSPNEWVTDTAGLLSPDTVSDLNARLREFERETGHQVLVYIAPTTGGDPIDDWAVRAFARWQVGRKGLDDGLVLFIFRQDRTIRVEVGYGLEPRVPDVLASRIIRETIAPAIAAGQPDRGVTAGVDQLLRLIGEPGQENSPAGGDDDNGGGVDLTLTQLVLIGVFGFILLAIAVRSPWLALALLVNIFGGRGGGFSGGGGGGFSGGGGRSGGGGASGGW